MTHQITRARIIREDDEYVVQAQLATGERYPDADYYTTDAADAVGTARAMVGPTGSIYATATAHARREFRLAWEATTTP